jgi:hypothetical protein
MHQVDVGRQAERAFEGTAELAVAQADEAGEIVYEDLPCQVGIDMRLDSLCLPSCQASAEDLSRLTFARAYDAGNRVGFAAKKRDRARYTCFGHLAIAIQRGAGSLDELSGHHCKFA